MQKLLGWLGAFVGSTLGWWGGAHAGIMTAFVLSTIGTGMGLYAGRWVSVHYFGRARGHENYVTRKHERLPKRISQPARRSLSQE